MSLEIKKGKRAIFLDRDGVINEDIGYAHRLDQLSLISGSGEAIARLNQAGYLVIVISNQAGIAYGYFTEDDMRAFNEALFIEIGKFGAHIDAFYFCPHHPTKGMGIYARECSCRKPAPGLLLHAAKEHGIDLESSYMIGDTWNDVEAGRRAGTTSILVKTGHGTAELQDHPLPLEFVAEDLCFAVDRLIR